MARGIVLLCIAAAALSAQGRDIAAAGAHGAAAIKEAKRAVDAATSNNSTSWLKAALPTWFLREPETCQTNEAVCEEEGEESASLLQRVRDSMVTAGSWFGGKTEEELEHAEDVAASLGHRVASFFHLVHPSAAIDAVESAAQHGSAMNEELQKELGIRSKSIGDKVADALEGLHLKKKSPEKIAAEQVAASIGSLQEAGHALSEGALSRWDTLLKTLHIREPSALDRAYHEYDEALHRIKVALGAESPTTPEKLAGLLGTARDNTANLYFSAKDWLRGTVTETGEQIDAAGDTIKATWNGMVAKTIGSVLDARDAASHAADAALKRAGIKERSRVEKAREGINTATSKLLLALGVRDPTFLEQLQGYGHSGKHLLTTAHGGFAHTGGYIDRMLKALHLRERSAWEKGLAGLDVTLHNIKTTLHLEEPTAQEKVSAAIDRARNQMRDLSNDVLSHVPSAEGTTDAAKAQYHRTISAAAKQYHSIRRDLDNALKAAGVKDKSTADKLSSGVQTAWHDFGVAIGVAEPTVAEKLSDMIPSATRKRRSDSIWAKTAKSLGLKRKSAAESARDSYVQALHRLKVALGQEDPNVTEKLQHAMTESQRWVSHAADSVENNLPDLTAMTAEARAKYESTAASTVSALSGVRKQLDGLLKHAGLKEKSKLEVGVAAARCWGPCAVLGGVRCVGRCASCVVLAGSRRPRQI